MSNYICPRCDRVCSGLYLITALPFDLIEEECYRAFLCDRCRDSFNAIFSSDDRFPDFFIKEIWNDFFPKSSDIVFTNKMINSLASLKRKAQRLRFQRICG